MILNNAVSNINDLNFFQRSKDLVQPGIELLKLLGFKLIIT